MVMETKNVQQGEVTDPRKGTAEFDGRIKTVKEDNKKITEIKNERESEKEIMGIGNNGRQLSIM